ncbi:hypothetical protein DFJ58DRAFT_730336 [Suillus subalutaceus]|uniref:uncharacterized protein n=1 Tax=Suillus subalutaceus TaxID=48586 RepID=UPI001B86973E|nr:uncharacterized protein DFJ58DRAFT_730336 [Suillus subalutaceus]KAG1847006.1 hypothetical protein DFJ58DRAFT_730336 [Suillus subalutaceus]
MSVSFCAAAEKISLKTVQGSMHLKALVQSNPVVIQDQLELSEEAVLLLQDVGVCIGELQPSLTMKRARMMKTRPVKISRSQKNSLSKTGQDARKYLKTHITTTFRRICGMKTKDKWPLPSEGERRNPDTDEIYYTPDFAGDVQDPTNVEIFRKAADVIWNAENWLRCLKSKTIHWNRSTLLVFAKETFRGFKSKSKAETDPQGVLAHTTNQHNTRRSNRRKEKASNLLAGDVIDQFKVQHDGTDPSPFVIPDHMSDEASAAGFAAENPISHLKFLEVVKPQWRSTQQSKNFDDLRDIWWTTKSSNEREKFAIPVRGSGHIPKVSPYDFGINLKWLNEARKERLLEERLKDWGKYGDPVHVEEPGAAAREGDTDTEEDAMATDGGGERETDGMGGAEEGTATNGQGDQDQAEVGCTT